MKNHKQVFGVRWRREREDAICILYMLYGNIFICTQCTLPIISYRKQTTGCGACGLFKCIYNYPTSYIYNIANIHILYVNKSNLIESVK